MTTNPFIQAIDISKRFVAVQALKDVNVNVNRGEIHALVGENGAGKSTLGKVISGIIRPDSGQLIVEGEAVQFTNPRQALLRGITTITQEIALLSKQTVLANVMLGQEITHSGILRQRAMMQEFERLVEMTGFDLNPAVNVRNLRMADQKKVEVMQAIARDAKLIIMDEPTAMLADDETEIFLQIVRQLKDMGRTIIYVSHFLHEVLNIADTVTVMRNGEIIRTAPTADETPQTLVEGMLGQSMSQMYPVKVFSPADAPVTFEVTGLQSEIFSGIDLKVQAGEIVGLAGLVGSGRSRLARTLFGAETITGGTIRVHGKPIEIKSTGSAIKAGIYMLPESRKEQGLLLRQPIRHNVTMPHLRRVSTVGGVINQTEERNRIQQLIESLNVQPPIPGNRANSLSGGNQQKVLFGKWLFERPDIFIIDEPTRGIDVGAKQAIYQLIVELAQQGMAILMISSEIEEILGLAHRVLVMRFGKIVAEFQDDASGRLDEQSIMRAAFGTQENPEESQV